MSGGFSLLTPRCMYPRVFLFFLVSADTEDVCIVERLFSSSLVAIVSLKAPRKLKVCHFKKGTEICNYSYSNTILAVKLNRQVSEALVWILVYIAPCPSASSLVWLSPPGPPGWIRGLHHAAPTSQPAPCWAHIDQRLTALLSPQQLCPNHHIHDTAFPCQAVSPIL